MSENTVSAKKRLVVITSLVCLLAIISFLLFYYGRQHKVIIDNRSVETADGQNFRALAGTLVAVNHQTLNRDEVSVMAVPPSQRAALSFKFWPSKDPSIEKAIEMMPRERILVKVLGPSFNLKFEAFDRAGESLGTTETNVHVGTRRDAMVRLVKLHNNMPGYLEAFPDDTINRQSRAADAESDAGSGLGEDGNPEEPSFGDM